jgi:hypothetical protein
MSVIDRPLAITAKLREQISALGPGESFSIERPITVDEFCDYTPDEGGWELVNGVIYRMSPLRIDRKRCASGYRVYCASMFRAATSALCEVVGPG